MGGRWTFFEGKPVAAGVVRQGIAGMVGEGGAYLWKHLTANVEVFQYFNK